VFGEEQEYFQIRMTIRDLTKIFAEPGTLSSTEANTLCIGKHLSSESGVVVQQNALHPPAP